jgi:diguanylate cyclase (GGDEF)-like protein
MEELLLWRWSTGIQTLSVVLITAFLTFGQRREGGAVLADWARAWQWNCVALIATWYFWLRQPQGFEQDLTRSIYLFAKTAFLAYLLGGVLTLRSETPRRMLRRLLWLLPLAFALLLGPFLRGIPAIGLTQASLIAAVCMLGVGLCLGRRDSAVGWLALGFLLRGTLAVAEAVGYGQLLLQPAADLAHAWALFIAAHSSLDLVAEWTLALGCVLALANRTQAALAASNAALRLSEQALREQAERDALTGLRNRRGFELLLQAEAQRSATLLFFDLDGFKAINDEHGHEVGDACLLRVADALRRHFREEDRLLRFAGDEFVVLTGMNDPEQIQQRVEAVRQDLAGEGGTLPIRFSVGLALLRPGEDPREALRRADAAMYLHKAERRAGAA